MGKSSLPFLCDDKKKSLQVVFLIFFDAIVSLKNRISTLFSIFTENVFNHAPISFYKALISHKNSIYNIKPCKTQEFSTQ